MARKRATVVSTKQEQPENLQHRERLRHTAWHGWLQHKTKSQEMCNSAISQHIQITTWVYTSASICHYHHQWSKTYKSSLLPEYQYCIYYMWAYTNNIDIRGDLGSRGNRGTFKEIAARKHFITRQDCRLLLHYWQKDTFLLVIMTSFQASLFTAFSERIVCLDSTHKTNQYRFKLLTVTVADEYRNG